MSLKNRSNFLRYTLETLKKQTLPKSDWELVVVDDGSTEDMEGFFASYSNDLNIKYIKIDSSRSAIPIWSHTPALSNNVGFKKAEGEVIVICGPEILHKETNLEIAYNVAMTNVAAFGLIYHSNLKFVDYVFSKLNPVGLTYNHYLMIPGARDRCITDDAFYWYFLAVKKSNIMKINGVDEEYGRGVCGEDDNFAARLQVSGTKNVHANTILGIHMEHEFGDDKYDVRRHRYTHEWKAARKLNTERWNNWHNKKEPLANVNKDWGSDNVIDAYKIMSNNIIYDNKNYNVTTNYNLKNCKVLYLPIGAQPGTEDAIKKFGVDLKVFSFWDKAEQKIPYDIINKQFLDVVNEFKPNLIHMQLQYTGVIYPETITEIKRLHPKCIITNWSGDVRANVPRYFIEIGKVVDYTLICNTGQIPTLMAAGCKNVKYWQMGIGTQFNFPQHKTEFKYDCCFIGNCYPEFPGYSQRVGFGKAMKQIYGSRCKILGAGWGSLSDGCVPWEEANNVYSDSKVVVSISNFNEIADYFSDRLLMTLATGRPVLSWTFPNIQKYIKDGYNAYVMSSIEEGIHKLHNILNKPLFEINNVGKLGAKTILYNHTFVSRFEELFKMIGIII